MYSEMNAGKRNQTNLLFDHLFLFFLHFLRESPPVFAINFVTELYLLIVAPLFLGAHLCVCFCLLLLLFLATFLEEFLRSSQA
jgi:hypothetical protein